MCNLLPYLCAVFNICLAKGNVYSNRSLVDWWIRPNNFPVSENGEMKKNLPFIIKTFGWSCKWKRQPQHHTLPAVHNLIISPTPPTPIARDLVSNQPASYKLQWTWKCCLNYEFFENWQPLILVWVFFQTEKGSILGTVHVNNMRIDWLEEKFKSSQICIWELQQGGVNQNMFQIVNWVKDLQ
jgi:hypothetical protein